MVNRSIRRLMLGIALVSILGPAVGCNNTEIPVVRVEGDIPKAPVDQKAKGAQKQGESSQGDPSNYTKL
jgi:hypothetical protein